MSDTQLALEASQKTRRVLIIAPALLHTDASTYVEVLATGLRAENVPVLVITSGGPQFKRLLAKGIKALSFPYFGRSIMGMLAYKRALKAAMKFNPNIIHAASSDVWRMSKKISERLNVAALVTLHTPVRRATELPWLTGRWPYSIVPTSALRENMVNCGGMPKTRVVVVRPGFESEDSGGLQMKAAKPGKPFEGKTKVVGCLAPLEVGMGVGMFINSAKIVMKTFPDAEFVIAGTGPLENRLRKQALMLGVRGNMTFVGNDWNDDELLQNFDILVIPSPQVAFPWSGLKAMSAGLPIVAVGSPGAFELLQEGSTGIIIPRGDDEALGLRITQLLGDTYKAEELGLAGLERILKKYPLSGMTQKTLTVYDMILEETT